MDEIEGTRRLAYNTVLTVLHILERKGYVTHEKAGRAFTYSPLIDQGQARRSALSHLLTRFFDDSPELLVLSLLQRESLGASELRRVRELVDASADARHAPQRERST